VKLPSKEISINFVAVLLVPDRAESLNRELQKL